MSAPTRAPQASSTSWASASTPSTSGDARELASRLAELEAERAFLHRCNVGGEAMSEADRQRVREVARNHRLATSRNSSESV
jgi:3-deoxy-D-arabino-heptulosonate 7-phosphate (DAHP) synthase class II